MKSVLSPCYPRYENAVPPVVAPRHPKPPLYPPPAPTDVAPPYPIPPNTSSYTDLFSRYKASSEAAADNNGRQKNSHHAKIVPNAIDEDTENNEIETTPNSERTEDIEAQIHPKENNPRKYYLPLYRAAIRGDWPAANSFFTRDPQSLTEGITDNMETVAHIAIGSKRNAKFLWELLNKMSPAAAANLADRVGRTPLHFAAIFGNIEAAKLFIRKVRNSPNVAASDKQLPIHYAAQHGQREMVSFLLPLTTSWENELGPLLLDLIIGAEFYSEALKLVTRYPQFSTEGINASEDLNLNPLLKLAGKASAFKSGTSYGLFARFIYSWFPAYSGHKPNVPQKITHVIWRIIGRFVPWMKHVMDSKEKNEDALQLTKLICERTIELPEQAVTSMFHSPILLAAKSGICEIVEVIMELYPSAIWFRSNVENHDVFQLAVLNRNEKVFNLIFQMTEQKHLILQRTDNDKNTLLHLAAKLAPYHRLNLVSGAALQLQRELQWFKGVEKLVRPDYKEKENISGETPASVFSRGHKDLVKEGEKWMKDTATSCSITSALIVTITFAASITVPGGTNSLDGRPILFNEFAYSLFAISNVLSLFSSTSSLLMFLSILTARYAEEDFSVSLPRRLIIGFVTLFLSITSMMVTFVAVMFLLFCRGKLWILGPVAALGGLPVTLFAMLQFPLLADMVASTYGSGFLHKQGNKMLL